MRAMKFTKCVLLSLLLCCGCDDHRLLHNLTESKASRLVGRLQQDGIDAEKVLQADGNWTLSVPEGVSSKSLHILTAERLLPDHAREKPQAAGLFASKEAQRLSYEQAVAHQIEELLLGIEGIVDVRVSLRLPEHRPRTLLSSEDDEHSSAAVLLLSKPKALPQLQELQALVARAAGVPEEKVHIMNREVQGMQKLPRTVVPAVKPSDTKTSLAGYVEWLVAFVIALLLYIGLKWKQQAPSPMPRTRERELFNRINE